MTKSIIVLTFALIAWFSAGRWLTLLLDRVVSVGAKSLAASPLRYDGGGFRIGGLHLTFGATNNLNFPLSLNTNPSGVLTLSSGNRTFTLGPRTNPVDPSGRPDIGFAAEPEDQVSLVTSFSPLGWPTPFEIRLMGGPSPWWKRYTYYRLTWKKHSGAKLEMVWRYEQQLFAAKGWSVPALMWNSQTGLISVDIHAESTGLKDAVVEYVGRTKGWQPGEYRIEERGSSLDKSVDLFAVVYLADEQSPHPGAGQSILLGVERSSRRVTREIGYQ